jgi:hypothetical protein
MEPSGRNHGNRSRTRPLRKRLRSPDRRPVATRMVRRGSTVRVRQRALAPVTAGQELDDIAPDLTGLVEPKHRGAKGPVVKGDHGYEQSEREQQRAVDHVPSRRRDQAGDGEGQGQGQRHDYPVQALYTRQNGDFRWIVFARATRAGKNWAKAFPRNHRSDNKKALFPGPRQDLNLRPPGYETYVARSCNTQSGIAPRFQIVYGQLRSAQMGKSSAKSFRLNRER